MITRVLVIYNNNDEKLSNYFALCAEKTICLFQNQAVNNIPFDILVDDDCCEDKLQKYLNKYCSDKLFLVIFSHGDYYSFYRDNERFFYDSPKFNLEPLKEGLLYSNACLVGEIFGRNLGVKGVPFFGFNCSMKINPNYMHVFINCDINGILYLLQGCNLQELKSKMVEYIQIILDTTELLQTNPLVAAYLSDYHEGMVIHGNQVKSFFINRKIES